MIDMELLSRENGFTFADLDRMPDDGLQYELVDGVLLVTPSPVPQHQRGVRELFLLVHDTAPADVEVFFSPLDFRPTGTRSLQPDVLAVRRSDVGRKNVTVPPLLVVEVLSPSTRAKDLMLKHGVYAESRVPHYWVFDPAAVSLRAWDLRDGEYVEVASVSGDEEWSATEPWPVTVVPSRLVG